MKRSGFGPRKSSLQRSPFALATAKTQMKRTAIKARVKKPTVAEGAKYLAACRGESCYLNVLCARSDWEDPSVVPCHSNSLFHGKGMGLKAKHEFTVPGCAACHRWLDQGPAEKQTKFDAWAMAFQRWEPARAEKLGIEYNELEEA